MPRVPYKWRNIKDRELHKFVFRDESHDEILDMVERETTGPVYVKCITAVANNPDTNSPFSKIDKRTTVLLMEDDDYILFRLKFGQDPEFYRGRRDWSKYGMPMGG